MEDKTVNPIDLGNIVKNLWGHRKIFFYAIPLSLVTFYLIICCIPRYYTCSVSLAPESGMPSVSGSVGAIASQFGLGSISRGSTQDALHAEIYPNILASNDFKAELMTVEVETKDGEVKTNYYTYLRDRQNSAWWNVIINTVLEWIKPTPKDSYDGKEKISVFNLTKLQSDIFGSLDTKINCGVDKKTSVITITVKDQDPLVCAIMANATCKKLQEFIVEYRTNKARIDFEHYKSLREQSKKEYTELRKRYVNYADANQDVFLTAYKTRLEDLKNEMQQKYSYFTGMNTQMQDAAARLQEAMPAFTVLQSASVPVRPAGPKRVIISIFLTIVVCFALSGYLLLKQNKDKS